MTEDLHLCGIERALGRRPAVPARHLVWLRAARLKVAEPAAGRRADDRGARLPRRDDDTLRRRREPDQNRIEEEAFR